ncbi:MAG: hypothetical protein EOM05_00310 [Clostridia bacterium]|nr:hypothetical protein [Clostridia bacterium]
MEMCYEGTLAMPSNYVVMDSEEMSYVEGGISKGQKAAIIAAAIGAGVALTAALVAGQIWVAGLICKYTFAAAVTKLGITGVAGIIGVSLGVSTTTVVAALAWAF